MTKKITHAEREEVVHHLPDGSTIIRKKEREVVIEENSPPASVHTPDTGSAESLARQADLAWLQHTTSATTSQGHVVSIELATPWQKRAQPKSTQCCDCDKVHTTR